MILLVGQHFWLGRIPKDSTSLKNKDNPVGRHQKNYRTAGYLAVFNIMSFFSSNNLLHYLIHFLTVDMFLFNFVLGSNFIFLCVGV